MVSTDDLIFDLIGRVRKSLSIHLFSDEMRRRLDGVPLRLPEV